MTLDRLFADVGIHHVRLLKIDCEGAEWGVIRGAARILSQGMVEIVALMFAGNCIYHLPSATPELLQLPNARTAAGWRD